MDLENNIDNILDGTKDLYPDDHKYNTFLKKVFRHEFRRNGFRRITTPIIEKQSLFDKAFLNDKELKKTLYTLKNQDNEDICLSSDPTVGIMRSYLNNNLEEEIQPVYFYYMERFLNKIKTNKESFKIGCEIIGEKDPILDAQLIFNMYSILKDIGLSYMIKIRINTLGNEKEMLKYLEELTSFYENKKHLLSEDSLKKIETNPMSLLSSTNEDEIILAKSSPPITKFLKKDSKNHYTKLKEYLELLGVPFEEDHTLVLEKNYYSSTLWVVEEIETNRELASGGRYDILAKRLGNEKDLPSTGFIVNTGNIVELLKAKKIKIRNKDKLDLYFVQLGDEPKKAVLPLSLEARKAGINTLTSLGTPSLKEQMLKAGRIGAKFVVLVGVMEARNGIFQVRDMEEGTQEEVKREDLIKYIIEKIGKEKLDFYSPAKDLVKG